MKKLTTYQHFLLDSMARCHDKPGELKWSGSGILAMPETKRLHNAVRELEKRGLCRHTKGFMYDLTFAGAEAINRTDLMERANEYLAYRANTWHARATALSYEDWWKANPAEPVGLFEFVALTDTGHAAATESAAEDVPERVQASLNTLRQALAVRKRSQETAVNEVELLRQERDDIAARLAQTQAALKSARDSLLDIRDLAKPYEDNDNFMFSRIVSHAEYGLKHSEDVAKAMGMETAK